MKNKKFAGTNFDDIPLSISMERPSLLENFGFQDNSIRFSLDKNHNLYSRDSDQLRKILHSQDVSNGSYGNKEGQDQSHDIDSQEGQILLNIYSSKWGDGTRGSQGSRGVLEEKSIQNATPIAEEHNSVINKKRDSNERQSKGESGSETLRVGGESRKSLDELSSERRSSDLKKSGDNTRKSSYKNFGITHDHASHPLNIIPLSPEDRKIIEEVHRREEDEEQQFQEGLVSSKEVKQIMFFKNAGIGSIITESSKEIDKIHKMLEEHRRRKSVKLEESSQGVIETPLSNNNAVIKSETREEKFISNTTVERREIGLQTGEEDPFSEPKEIECVDIEPWLDEEIEKKSRREIKDHKPRHEDNLILPVYEDLSPPKGHVLEEKEDANEGIKVVNFEERRNRKKVNVLQKKVIGEQPKNIKERPGTENIDKQFLSKTSTLQAKRRQNIRDKYSKENFAPANKSNERISNQQIKKNNGDSLSIDLSQPEYKDGLKKVNRKNDRGSTKSNGSYLKKFLECKERRKLNNKTQDGESHGTPKKSPHSSKSSFSKDTPGERLSTKNYRQTTGENKQQRVGMVGNIDANTVIDLSDFNGLTDRGVSNRGLFNTPNSSYIYNIEVSEKNPKELKLVRYSDYRTVRRAQRKGFPHPLSQQLAKLELNNIKENQKDQNETISNQRNNNPSQERQLKTTERAHRTNQSVSHSISNGMIKAKPLQENNGIVLEKNKITAQTSREDDERRQDLKEFFKIGSNSQTNLNNKVTYESLLKSLKLRQEMMTKLPSDRLGRKSSGVKESDVQEGKEEHAQGTAGFHTKRREEDGNNIYNKSLRWLSSKQKKLDNMHMKEMQDEMKECTFRPQLLARELAFKLDFNHDNYAPKCRDKPSDQLNRIFDVEQK